MNTIVCSNQISIGKCFGRYKIISLFQKSNTILRILVITSITITKIINIITIHTKIIMFKVENRLATIIIPTKIITIIKIDSMLVTSTLLWH